MVVHQQYRTHRDLGPHTEISQGRKIKPVRTSRKGKKERTLGEEAGDAQARLGHTWVRRRYLSTSPNARGNGRGAWELGVWGEGTNF
mmetsp:Transcript_27114/g.55236  ORF Transcript_27114/g.55236 Transcript_27114/m.55236 type:complete len:87 (-) Transcript_27114:241-501(-)